MIVNAVQGVPMDEGGDSSAAVVTKSAIADRLRVIRSRIAEAALTAGRQPGDVNILLATKTQAVRVVGLACQALVEMGLAPLRLGENRSREGRDKAAELGLPDIRWSMIGHVQTNKVGEVLEFATEVQSLDRLSLAAALERQLQRRGQMLDVLVQVNTSGEASKFGLQPSDVQAFLRDLSAYSALRVTGFMTIATLTNDIEERRRCFRVLRQLRDQAKERDGEILTELSMGMSSDYELAVEEGATCVRLGEAVFGPRSFRPTGGWWPEGGTV
ncbi:hypothetical protein SAMN05519103_06501 [Rhizobiales bacterium GAS113]|nr:hypothetical protein SAMN05519103_06501 [Rhizobiales bacterium GAS113]